MHHEQPSIRGIALERLRQLNGRIRQICDVEFDGPRRDALYFQVERQWAGRC